MNWTVPTCDQVHWFGNLDLQIPLYSTCLGTRVQRRQPLMYIVTSSLEHLDSVVIFPVFIRRREIQTTLSV